MNAATRITCPACNKGVALTAKGEIRKHGYEAFSSRKCSKNVGCCYMSYEKPENYAAARLANAEKGLAQAKADLERETDGYRRRVAQQALDLWTRELAKARG